MFTNKKIDGNIYIRMAKCEDAKALLDIYKPYVEKTAITFEYEVPSEVEFASRIEHTLERYPYLVAERGGKIVGYAYASPFKTRAAYAWSVETSIYVEETCRGLGVGKALYEQLEYWLKKQQIINVNACITYPNPASIHFHEQFGYKQVAHFTKCGYKLGKWRDMIWMEKMLGEHPDVPNAVKSISEVLEETEII